MTLLDRRTLVKVGTAAASASALTGPALFEWARAWAQNARWQPERVTTERQLQRILSLGRSSSTGGMQPPNLGQA
jgi:hypothetical protein